MSRNTKTLVVSACSLSIAAGLLSLLPRAGWFTMNWTASAPAGVYLQSAPADATYITFCLERRHAAFRFYDQVCHPDNEEGMRLIKLIETRQPDGDIVVAGRGDIAIDSRLLGSIKPAQIRGWWVPVLTLGEKK